MISSRIKRLAVLSILAALFILYISFLYMDFNNLYNTDKLKYISILLCFILSLMTIGHEINITDTSLLQLGLLLTTLADLHLLLLENYILGVAIFCFVQIIYSIRYTPTKIRSTIIGLLIAFEVIVILYIVLGFFIKDLDFLFVVAFTYSICLTTSVTRSFKACRGKFYPSPNRYMIALGMFLFLLCDINVGLTNALKMVTLHSPLSESIYNTSVFLIWFFYLPSQALLAMSGYDFKKLLKGS